MAPPRIRKVFSGFAPDLQIYLKGPCTNLGLIVRDPMGARGCLSLNYMEHLLSRSPNIPGNIRPHRVL